MRIERLDLIRYGKFTGHTLNFGEGAAGAPDFHIVYGPNEAGKSTLFNAWLDLLFGIEPQSKFNFLHAYDTMRIGARLYLGDRPLTLARVKKRNGSLLDEADLPLPEGLLQAALAGVDRDAYRTMFSLDDKTLETGGEAILESKGDLGQLLFSASSGLAALSQQLSGLHKQADEIHRPGARTATQLRELKRTLDELAGRRKELDTAASAYAKLVKDRDQAGADYDTALSESARLKQRLGVVAGLLQALPRLSSLRRLRDTLAPLQGLREAPAGWADALPDLIREEPKLEERARASEARIEALERDIEAIEIDEAALALAPRIDDLANLAARHTSAAADLPEERARHDEAEARIAHILRKLERDGEDAPETLVLPAATVARLRELIEAHATVIRETLAARNELDAAREAERKADAEAEDAGADAGDHAALAALKAQLPGLQTEAARIAAERRQAERTIASLRERLDACFERLLPWQGDADALARLRVPDPAALQAWEDAGADLRDTQSFQKEQIGKFSQKRDRLTAGREALEQAAGLLDEAAATRVRAAREAAWAAHAARLDAETAAAFREALEQDDALTAARLAQSADRADHKRMSVELAEVVADLAAAQKIRDDARAEAEALKDEIAASLRKCDPALADFTPATLRAWLGERDKALELRTDLRQSERDLTVAAEEQADVRQRLVRALEDAGATVGGDTSLTDLLERGQTLVDGEARMAGARKRLEECRSETRRREAALQVAEEAAERWQKDWSDACSRCWFGEVGAPSPETVRALVDELNHLAPALEARDGVARRIEAMEAVATAFRQACESLGDELGLPATADPRDLFRDLSARAAAARKAHERREALRENLNEARNSAGETAEAIAALRDRKAEMTAHFEVATFDEVQQAFAALRERARLRSQAAELEGEILTGLGLADMAQAEARLEAADREALETERAETEQRIEDQDARLRELYAGREKAAEAVASVGGDDTVARLEEQRQTVLLEIEESAKGWLRLKAGILAAEQALRAYRDNHRSSMMERASAAFRKISCGAFQGLVTQSNGEREELIGIDHRNASKRAGEMSKGTCFQLYLALRIAGYHEFVASRASLPFIADDILETFDDERAAETIRLLAEMGEKGQVIYLTHHPHLCAIAKKVCPTATLHELPGPLAG
ncbi:uncharacterized protein YhaN [Breoghania corrubedonensis]|uniref:Uncharacterized protein YhaN n=1 Tax=Breoghania corrubedonensis TaxID=665038 RepID=A0A2T5V7S7_9HYPH|nr:AAA family ATPase [Breoghania corrubedonensis]PTW59790.1 uncharacterized protein YhaN [Breoghania corrubedonensis]